VAQVNKQS